MTQLGKLLLFALGFAIISLGLRAATPVLAVPDRSPEPFVITSEIGSATPFNITFPNTTSHGRRVKTVVVEFITSDCEATTATTVIGAARLRAEFDGNFAFYTLSFEPPILFSNLSEFVSVQKTLIFGDPGSRLDYGFSGGAPTCTVVFSGHLILH